MKNDAASRAVIAFVLRFGLVFALLIIPWAGWNGAYGQYFRFFAQGVLNIDGGNRIVRFVPTQSPANPNIDTQMTLANRDLLDRNGRGLVERTVIDSRSIGWVPTALTVAFICATPIPWRRRVGALAGGLVLIHLYIIVCLQSWIWDNSAALSLGTLPKPLDGLAGELDYTLMNQLGASFSVPVLIWIVVTFRRQDGVILASKRSREVRT